jgi:polysaccharide pyruvyl transferase WcaK-like protein
MPRCSDQQRRVVLLDFWSDNNRGDAAMQVGLVRLLRKRLPGARMTLITAYGANQAADVASEFDETGPHVDSIVGGFRLTAVPFRPGALRRKPLRRLANLLLVGANLLLFPVWVAASMTSALDRLLPGSLRQSASALRDADIVIWNGRNFRANSTMREPYEMWGLIYNPLVALVARKRVACVGASVWPLRNPLARAMVRTALSKTRFVSLRERESFESAIDLLGSDHPHLELSPDLSFAMLSTPPTWSRGSDGQPMPRTLGITLVDWVGSGYPARARYISELRLFLEWFLEFADTRVVIVPQVTYGMEATDLLERELLDGMPTSSITVIRGRPRVSELLDLYRGLDILIATRMHSAIFALSQGTPVVTIPYDEGGKWGILEMLGVRDVAVPYRIVRSRALGTKLADVWARREDTRREIARAMPALQTRLEESVDRALIAAGAS